MAKVSVYEQALKFKKKYPRTICWRIKEHASVVEKHLNPGEYPIYTFVAQKDDNFWDLFSSAVICLTNKRILIGRKRVVFGYFLDSITPDMFNDLKVKEGVIWGKIYIDTIKEFVTLSNIAPEALTDIETAITSYMMEAKKLYPTFDSKND